MIRSRTFASNRQRLTIHLSRPVSGDLIMRLLTAACLLLTMSSMTSAAELKPGDKCPDFAMKGSDGKTYKLSDMKGKTAFVIAWFPKAFTGG
jgi:peroxiredoxin Q/BCP